MTLPLFGAPLKLSCELAVWGLIAGELASNLYNICSLFFARFSYQKSESRYAKKVLKLALPLSSTRLIVSLLGSLEAVLIPAMLLRYGLTKEECLYVYGVLSGMVIPFLMFPGAITNSLSVLLLPTISNAYSKNDRRKIKVTSQIAIKYTLLLGLLATFIFSMFGKTLGNVIYGNETAGNYLFIMSILCPFIYCSTTLASIINGLGKAHITFRNTVIGLGIRILFLVVLTPKMGITGYWIGLFISQILITILDGQYLYRVSQFHLEIFKWFVFPSLFLYINGFVLKQLIRLIPLHIRIEYIHLLLIPIISILFIIYLYKKQIISRTEF